MTVLKLPNGLVTSPIASISQVILNSERDKTIKDIDAAIVKRRDRGTSYGYNKLGASSIGDECWRKLWLDFRKVRMPTIDGRTQRIFEKGDDEEIRLLNMLREAGWTVDDKDENGKQHSIGVLHGHYTGKLDAFVKGPPDTALGEFVLICDPKSMNNKNYKKFIKSGVRVSHPKYYAQLCSYGARYGLIWGMIIAINKDTEEVSLEIIKLDVNYGKSLHEKAGKIINAITPPNKISNDSANFKCKICQYNKDDNFICHEGEGVYWVNCRSCKYGRALENGKWHCAHETVNDQIPDDFIMVGCQAHERII